jgi:hypothetical protein
MVIKEEKFRTFTRDLRRLRGWLLKCQVTEIVMESTGQYWRPVWNILEPAFAHLVLVNPLYVKALKGPPRRTGRTPSAPQPISCAAFGDRVCTPPLAAGCLPGITREVVLHECHIPRFTVEECTLYPTDLERADQVFITSTTRELLLVEEIEGLRVQARGGAREALQSAFSSYVDTYVAKKSESRPAVHL